MEKFRATIPNLKKCAGIIEKEYQIKPEDSQRIISTMLESGSPAGLDRVGRIFFNGDLSQVPAFAEKLKISILLPDNNRKKKTPARIEEETPKKKTTGRKKTNRITTPERVQGEIVEDIPRGQLPPDIVDRIDAVIFSTAEKYKIDDIRKAPATVWRSLCMTVGFMFRQTKLLEDIQREREHGGKIYDAERVAALLEVWAIMCGSYDKAPLAADFIAFSGISENWFYNNNGQCDLTSARAGIREKLLKIQEAGISSALVDGRRNPTGAIFFLKNWHGWRDQREIVHTDGRQETPTSYPKFIETTTDTPRITENGDL